MLFSSPVVTALVLGASVILGAPKCIVKEQRKSWRTLTNSQKLNWLNAEKCLMKLPAKQGFPGAITRWDDLSYAHIQSTSVIHDVGAFLPWHRYYMWAHVKLLKEECGFRGPVPYWDEPLDAGAIAASPLFSSPYGFGGNGRASDGCVVDGPFANLTLHLGPAYEITDFCLARAFNETRFATGAQATIDICNTYTDYVTYSFCLQATPHTAGHGGVSGLQRDTVASPGDPIFFMHHNYLDYQWWNWQKQNLTSRLVDMGGRNVPTPEWLARFPYVAPVPEGWLAIDGDPANVTTLNHNLGSEGLYPGVKIKDVMDIQGGFLCYEYV